MDITSLSAESLLNLDFNLLWSKWNPQNTGLTGKRLCMSEERLIRTSFVIRISTWSFWGLNCCRNFYNNFATSFLYETPVPSTRQGFRSIWQFNKYKHVFERTRKWNHQYCVGYFFLPDWMGESLNFLNAVPSPLQSWTCIKDRAAFVGPIWKERGQPAEKVKRRRGMDFVVQGVPRGFVYGPRICQRGE